MTSTEQIKTAPMNPGEQKWWMKKMIGINGYLPVPFKDWVKKRQ